MMFNNIDVVGLYADKISEVVTKDRSHYQKYLEIVEKYITGKPIILGRISSYKTIIQQDLNPNEYQYNLYATNIFNHAKEMAGEMYKTTGNMYIYVKTKILNRSVAIYVDEREIVTIDSIENCKGADIVELIGPVVAKALFTDNQIHLMSPEVSLIDIYRGLHSPQFAKKWEEYLGIERGLYEIFVASVKIDKFTEGSAEKDDKSSSIHEKLMAQNDVYHSVTSSSRIRTGTRHTNRGLYVFHLFSNVYVSSLQKHDIIESLKIDEYTEESIGIPFDLQLRRLTLFKDGRPLIFIYNSMQYDLINDTPFTRLRFMLVELWMLQLKRNTGKLDSNIANRLISDTLTLIKDEHNKIENAKLTTQYFPDKFFGVYYNEQIFLKQHMLASRGDRPPPGNWYPKLQLLNFEK